MRVFSLERVPVGARVDLLREAFGSYPIPMSLELSRADAPTAEFHRVQTAFGLVERFRVSGASGTVRRGPAADSALPELLTIHLERSGHVVLEQDGRSAAPRPGDLVLSTNTLPFATRQEWESAQHTVSIEVTELGLDPGVVARATAVALSAHDPLLQVIATFLGTTARAALDQRTSMDALAPVTREMVRVLIATVLRDETRLRSALALSLGERLMLFIDLHLADPELSAAMIARAHAISVRYLYVVLRSRGVSLGEYIRGQRIARARQLLADPVLGSRPLAEIARLSGFADYSTFARTLRASLGVSPRELRADLALAPVHGSPTGMHPVPTTALSASS